MPVRSTSLVMSAGHIFGPKNYLRRITHSLLTANKCLPYYAKHGGHAGFVCKKGCAVFYGPSRLKLPVRSSIASASILP